MILALNCGSSSLKFGVYSVSGQEAALLCEGEAEEIGGDDASFWFKQQNSAKEEHKAACADHSAALACALDVLRQHGITSFSKAGHRVVHGGPSIREHQILTPEVLQKLEEAVPFAPLHLPATLKVINAVQRQMPDLEQVICLDTAFHRSMPDVARTFALPLHVQPQLPWISSRSV